MSAAFRRARDLRRHLDAFEVVDPPMTWEAMPSQQFAGWLRAHAERVKRESEEYRHGAREKAETRRPGFDPPKVIA